VHAIETEALAKRFGAGVALDGVDLAVSPGTIYGLLGPTGHGIRWGIPAGRGATTGSGNPGASGQPSA
jgi:hypothetical protein